MKTILLFIGLLIHTIKSSKCKQVINGDAVYLFDDLQAQEYKQILNETSTLYFRFCQPVTKCSTTITKSFAVIVNNEGLINQECVSLVKTDQYFADVFELVSDEATQEGVIGNFNNSENGFSISFVLYCNSDLSNLNIMDVEYNNLHYTLEMESDDGCPLVLFSNIIEFLQENSKLLAAILIIIGLTECLIGKKILKPTLFIIGYLLGFFFALFILSELDTGNNPFYLWIGMMISVLLGAFVGGISMHLDKAGIIAVGIGLGVVLALLLWNAILAQFLTSDLILYTLMIIFSVICSMISFRLFDHLIIFSTSLLGSYLVFKAIGMIAGGFPSEISALSNRDSRYYIYFACILVLASFGIYYQYKQWGQRMLTYDEFVEKMKDSKPDPQEKELQDLLNDKSIQGFQEPDETKF